jgi:hypothetical protein
MVIETINSRQSLEHRSSRYDKGKQRVNGAKNASPHGRVDWKKSTYVQGVLNVQRGRRVQDSCFTKGHFEYPTVAAAELRKKIDDEPSVFMYTYRHDPS